jgi:sulfatase maturation enzyme AslB (radical SAM superfamily)
MCEKVERIIQVESVGYCNGKCPYCPSGISDSSRGGHITQEIIDKSVRLLEQAKNKKVWVHLRGEPFLHKELPREISCLKTIPDMKVATSTNLTVVTKESVEKVFESGIDILALHLSGFLWYNNDVNELLKRWHMIEQANWYVRDGEVEITLNYALNKRESGKDVIDMFKMSEYWKSVGDRFINFYQPHPWIELRKNRLDPEVYRRNLRECDFLKYNAVSILADGRIVRCCLDMWGESYLHSIKDSDIKRLEDLRVSNLLCYKCQTPQKFFREEGVI